MVITGDILTVELAEQPTVVVGNPPFPRKLACWPLGCGCDVDAGPRDVEAWALAA